MKNNNKPVLTENIFVSKPASRLILSKKNVRWFVLGIVLVVVGLGWWLFATDRLVYNGTKSERATSVVVCGIDIVSRYNDATYYMLREGSENPTMDEKAVEKLVAEIKNKNKYDTDPTCQTILLWDAIRNDTYPNARTAYDAVKNLHEQGRFADSNLRANEPLFMYEEIINGLSGSGVQVNEEGTE